MYACLCFPQRSLECTNYMATPPLHELRRLVPEPLEELLPDEPQPAPRPRLAWLVAVLKRIQKYAAYSFLGFFGLHIASTVITPGLGVRADRCSDLFEMCRNVYLSGVVEYGAVYATAGAHVTAGVLLRIVKTATARPPRRREHDIIIRDGNRDDIGLGGLGTVLGLGFKKLWVSTHFPSLTPLSVLGYVMAAALGYHVYKMRLAPLLVDGDLSLVTLLYVTHYLHQLAYGRAGAVLNYALLALLLWVSFYHVVSGLFKYRRQYSLRAKKIAYGVIATLSALTFVAMTRFKLWRLETGFMGEQFAKYLYK